MSATTSDGNAPYINQMLSPYQPFGESLLNNPQMRLLSELTTYPEDIEG